MEEKNVQSEFNSIRYTLHFLNKKVFSFNKIKETYENSIGHFGHYGI